MSTTVRVGLIGCGFIGDYHARAINACSQAVLVAAASRTQASLERFCSQFTVPVTTTDPSRITRASDIDAVVIATPNFLHAPQAIDALRHGKHVLVEKPMAMNYAEARRMVQAASQAKRYLQIGHMWRFDTEVRYLHDVIASGRLGRITKTKGYGIHVHWGPMGWFTKKKEAGGGALIDMGVHAIDTASYLLGDPEPISVYAKIGTFYGPYDVDDTGVVMIEWAGGTVSLVESGWWHPYMDGPEAATQVFGTEGYGRIFPAELHYQVGTAHGVFRPVLPDRKDHCEQGMYDLQMEAFIQSIINETTPSPDGAHGAMIMRILDAAYASARTGKAIRLS